MNKYNNINLDKIDAVFYDFDYTLAIHEKTVAVTDQLAEALFNPTSTHFYDTERESKPNALLKDFMNLCKDGNIPMFLCSTKRSVPEAEMALNWVTVNYGHTLQNACVSKRKNKLLLLIAYASNHDLPHENILIVDDSIDTLYDCAAAGFKAASPMEVVNFIWERAGYTLCEYYMKQIAKELQRLRLQKSVGSMVT